jgi:predicted esterase
MRRMLILLLVLAALPTTVYAQNPPSPEEQKAEAFQQAFDAGMDAIRNKKYQLGIRAFKFCTTVYPERPTAYYNLACIYSLINNKKDALNMLETALAKGFSSFEHMTRDPDLNNIRKEKRYIALVAKHRKKLLNQLRAKIFDPKGHKGKRPLLIFLHGRNQNPDQYVKLMTKVAQSRGFGLILPRGDVAQGGNARWGQGAETAVMAPLKKALESGKYDAQKVMIGGFSDGSYHALEIALKNPKAFAGVLNFGTFFDESLMTNDIPSVAKAGMKIYMVSGLQDPLLESAIKGRNAFAKARVPVVLRRFNGAHRLPTNFDALISEGLRFLVEGKAPKQGKPRSF